MTMAREQREEQVKAYGRIVARTWSDEPFKQRFLREPAAVLREYGIHVPERMQVHAHEANDTAAHLVLPARPAGGAALTDDQLVHIAGGAGGVDQLVGGAWSIHGAVR